MLDASGARGNCDSGFLCYRDPALLGSRMVLAGELVAQNNVRERAEGFDVVPAWRDRRVDVSVRPGVQLTPALAQRAGPFALFQERGSRGVERLSSWGSPTMPLLPGGSSILVSDRNR